MTNHQNEAIESDANTRQFSDLQTCIWQNLALQSGTTSIEQSPTAKLLGRPGGNSGLLTTSFEDASPHRLAKRLDVKKGE